MPDYFLSAEAQNFGASIFDTEDLSTIRGASILCLDATKALSTQIPVVQNVTVGASSGIWKFTATDLPAAQLIISQARAILAEATKNHFTFTVACVAGEAGDFVTAKKQLRAAMLRAQLSSAGLSYPTETSATLCPVDLMRPVDSSTSMFIDGEPKPVSRSVHDRRKHGIAEKQELIQNLTGLATQPFAFLLSSISEGGSRTDLKSNLADKIAVIHFDGNGFGKVQDASLAEAVGTKDQLAAQKGFDDKIQSLRKGLIVKIYTFIINNDGIGAPSAEERELREVLRCQSDVVRFETLLWGGDEVTFIVPARLGWQVAELIAEDMKSWDIGGHALTSAIGIVFCHHDAPIARIRALADRMVTHLKTTTHDWQGHDRPGRAQTLFFPLVLESFDHIGDQLDDYLDKRAKAANAVIRPAYFALEPDEMSALRALADALRARDDFSRRRLRGLANAAHTGRVYRPATTNPVRDAVTSLAHLLQKAEAAKTANASELVKFGDPNDNYRRAWMLLEDYWDYLLPCEKEDGQ